MALLVPRGLVVHDVVLTLIKSHVPILLTLNPQLSISYQSLSHHCEQEHLQELRSWNCLILTSSISLLQQRKNYSLFIISRTKLFSLQWQRVTDFWVLGLRLHQHFLFLPIRFLFLLYWRQLQKRKLKNARKTPKILEAIFLIYFLGPPLNFVDLFADPSIINWVANRPASFVVYPRSTALELKGYIVILTPSKHKKHIQ